MAGELKLSFIIEAVDRGTQVLDRIGQRMEAFGRSYSGIASMVGGGLEIKAAIDEDSYFRRLAALTRTPLEEMDRLKAGIHDTAIAARVSSSELTGAFDSFKQGGGSVADFRTDVDSAGAAIALLGGHGAETGRIMAALERSFAVKGPEEMASSLALMTAQLGKFNTDIEAFAQAFPDMAEKYAALGFSGQEAQRDLTATYLALAQTSRSPRAAYGGMNEVLSVLQTEHGRMHFTAATGIRTEDQSGHARSLTDVIKDIAAASHDTNRRWLLENVLSGDAINAFAKFGTEGGSKTLDTLLKTPADPTDFAKRANEATEGIGGALQKTQEKLKATADGVVTSIDGITSALEKVDPQLNVTTTAIGIFGTALFSVAAIGGSIAAVRNFKDAVSGLIDLMRKAPTKIPAAAAESAPAAAAATPAAEGVGATAASAAGVGLGTALGVGAGIGVAAGVGNYYGNRYLRDTSGGEIDPYGGMVDPNVGIPFWGLSTPPAPTIAKTAETALDPFGDGSMIDPYVGMPLWSLRAPPPTSPPPPTTAGTSEFELDPGLPPLWSLSAPPAPPIAKTPDFELDPGLPPLWSLHAPTAPSPVPEAKAPPEPSAMPAAATAPSAPGVPAPAETPPPAAANDNPALDRFDRALDRGTAALAAFTDELVAFFQRADLAPSIVRATRPEGDGARPHATPPRSVAPVPEHPAPAPTPLPALDHSLPRGIRNNNPLNLEYHAGQGAIGSDGRFGVYRSMSEGVAADYRQLLRYQARGIDTIDAIVSKWAPSSENDTSSYEADVARRTALNPTAHLDLRDLAIATSLIAAMGHRETGRDLDPDAIGDGVRLGLSGMRGPAIEEWSRRHDDAMKAGADGSPVLQRFASAAPVNVGGQVAVQFQNAPAGMRVKSIKSEHPNVALDVGMGLSMRNGTP